MQGRAGAPAAARYVRAQGLRAGVTDSEREIPGGGGAAAALPWSRCQPRRLPASAAVQTGKQSGKDAPGGVRAGGRAARAAPPGGARRPGSRGQAAAVRGCEERARLAVARRGAGAGPGRAGRRRAGRAGLAPARRAPRGPAAALPL